MTYKYRDYYSNDEPDYDLDKYKVFRWAYRLFKGHWGEWVILDTETTSLNGEVIELAVISKYGSPLIDTLIKPVGEISEGAQRIHGISKEMLQNAPTFSQIFDRLCEVVKDKIVLIYNSGFDVSRLEYTAELHGLKMPKLNTRCAMNLYAQYYGEWHNYWGNYTWQALPSGNHRAIGDAIACYNLLKEMAQPLSCPVTFPPKLFPPIQYGCKWEDWLKFDIYQRHEYLEYVGYRLFKEIKIKRPRFGRLPI